MKQGKTIVAAVWANSAWSVVGRLYNQAGSLVTQAMLSSISYRAYRKEGNVPREITSSATAIVVADTIFDTLQTNFVIWPEDSTGYNFKWDVPYTLLKKGGDYEIEISFTPASGDPYPVVIQVSAESLHSR